MGDIVCYTADGEVLRYFTQWDVNQKLVINGADTSSAPVFYFLNANIDVAYTVQSTINGSSIIVSIPDVLLQYDVPIIVYVEYERGTTEYSIRIPVMPRARPSDYIITDGSGSGPGSGSGSQSSISIINNLITQNANAALSAMQGYVLNEKIKNIEEIKVNNSDIENVVSAAVSDAIENLEIPTESGRGIVSVDRTSGDGGPGSIDTYTITYTDNTTSTFKVYNGIDGVGGGSGDGSSSVLIVDNLTTNNKNAALSASQGLILKEYIDELNTTKISSDDLDDIISEAILNSNKNYTEILPEASYSVSEDMGILENIKVVNIRAGKTYLVSWNGVEYICDAYKYNDEITILGSNDYPFYMECYIGSTDIYSNDGSTIVTLAVYEYAKYATEQWVEKKFMEYSSGISAVEIFPETYFRTELSDGFYWDRGEGSLFFNLNRPINEMLTYSVAVNDAIYNITAETQNWYSDSDVCLKVPGVFDIIYAESGYFKDFEDYNAAYVPQEYIEGEDGMAAFTPVTIGIWKKDDYTVEKWVQQNYQPKGNYVTEELAEQILKSYVKKDEFFDPDGNTVPVYYTTIEPQSEITVFDPSEIDTNGNTINVGDWIVTPSGKVYVVTFVEDYGVEANYAETPAVKPGYVKTVNGVAPDENGNVEITNETISPTITVDPMDGGHDITITDINGTQTFFVPDGKNGDSGVGVASINQTTTSTANGGTNVITAILTDGEISTFNIKNGTKGKDGVGVSSITQTTTSSSDGGTNVITATLTDGKTSTFNIKNGATGQNGVSVVSVTQTTTSTDDGGENVITVTLSNGNVSTFKIKNGARGSNGASATVNGLNVLTINTENGITKSQNGSIFTIGGDLTGLLASGPIILKQGADYHYGDTLPESGTEGRLFFLKKKP